MNDAFSTAMCILIVCVFYIFGWASAHNTVATECEKLGAFYVGKTVYECKAKQG